MRSRGAIGSALSAAGALSILVPVGVAADAFSSANSGAIDHGALSLAIRLALADAVVASVLGVLLVMVRRHRAALMVLGIWFTVAAAGSAVLERTGTMLTIGDRGRASESLRDVWDTMTGTGAALVPSVWIVGTGAVVAALIVLARKARMRLIRAV